MYLNFYFKCNASKIKVNGIQKQLEYIITLIVFYFLLIDSMANTGDSTLFKLIQDQLAKINWLIVAYIISSIIITATGVNILMPMGTSRASIFGVGAVLVSVFYYYRWFSNVTAPVVNWPPVINSCPDYLTLVKQLPGLTVPGCVDMLGVSTNGGLKPTISSDLTANVALSSNKVFQYTSEDIMKPPAGGIKSICTLCQQLGITWEGVWDGDVCTGIASSNNINAAAGSKCT